MPTALHADSEVMTTALDLHEQRRGRGRPTVSVLTGPIGLALRQVRSWTEARGRSVVRITDPDPDTALDAWVARLADEHDLPQAAITWLARRISQDAADLGRRLRGMTPFERNLFLDEALADAAGTGLDVVGRSLLATLPSDTHSARTATAADLTAVGLPRPLLATTLLELLPGERTPVVLISAGRFENSGECRLDQTAEAAAKLAEAEPRLTVLLAADSSDLHHYLGEATESRARALVRESLIRVSALDADTLRRRLDDVRPGLADALADSTARLSFDGATEALAALFGAAALAAEDLASGVPEAADRARSTAERFLFERLESLPETAGLFCLNGRTGFAFAAGHPMEVDILAVDLRLAIEVDGYYHFRDPDAYRRDRRKDLELQRRGYLVVRVLADDVVRRLEEILETILAAVAHQTRSTQRS